MDVYSMLDAPRVEMLQRAQMRFPICTYQKFKEGVCSQTINATFPITKSQRAKKLMFAFHWNGNAAKSLDATSISDNLINATATPYKSQIGYHPTLPIQ
jgi:hypothetical protein